MATDQRELWVNRQWCNRQSIFRLTDKVDTACNGSARESVPAPRFAKIGQCSAQQVGSVTANAAVSGIELVPGLSPNPELTQKSPFLFMQSDDACWHLHNSIPGKFANVAHYFRPSAHNIFRMVQMTKHPSWN
jgi:hypothetical protein